MAKLAKEKFLVLLVNEAGYDYLSIGLPEVESQCGSFLGSISDGQDLIACIAKTKEAECIPVPLCDLLVMGLMMPRKDGLEVLRWLRSQPFEGLTVVVLGDRVWP